ncbi:uncharacterized protein LOC100679886 isoform X3 [Nasonia vitripennis]|nr:uncharacterized protein LOC100679886 isoform X3 [Nasonia vitripennis]
MYEFLREKRAILERNKENRKRFYADRANSVRENLLELRAEFKGEIPPVKRKKRGNAQASKKGNNGKNTRRETLFNSSGMVLLLCTACNTSKPKINSQKETHCKQCGTKFRFQCVTCSSNYTTHTSCNQHIKYKHLGVERKSRYAL